MRHRAVTAALTAVALFGMMAATAAQQPITIRAGTMIDGKGGVERNVTITIDGPRIAALGRNGEAGGNATYNLSRFTVLPGLIDTHVHIGTHFGKDGRASNAGETPTEQALAGAENAYAVLMSGFTTVQSVGAPSDVPLRAAIASGRLPGRGFSPPYTSSSIRS